VYGFWPVSLRLSMLILYIPDSTKVALGIGKCALARYCLAVTQANHCSEFRMPEYLIANDELPKKPLKNQAYIVMGAK